MDSYDPQWHLREPSTLSIPSGQGIVISSNSPVQDFAAQYGTSSESNAGYASINPIVIQGNLGYSQSKISAIDSGFSQTITTSNLVTSQTGGGIFSPCGPAPCTNATWTYNGTPPYWLACNLSTECSGQNPSEPTEADGSNYQHAFVVANVSGSTCDDGALNGTGFAVSVATLGSPTGQIDITIPNVLYTTSSCADNATITFIPVLGAYGEDVQFLDATNGAFTVAMPAANAPLNAGLTGDSIGHLPPNYAASMQLYVARTDDSGNAITIQAGTGDTINGSSTYTLSTTQYAVVHFVSDGNHTWYAFSGGGGDGSGTVTEFIVNSADWPSWLVPTVTDSTTTPTLKVAASASGTGDVALTNSPTFVTPALGAATATSINGVVMSYISAGVNLFLATTTPAGITTGEGNFGFGLNTLSALTSGTANYALGFENLMADTTGNGNIAIGQGVLLTNTAGSFNLGIGTGALVANTADDNIGIGYGTLQDINTGAKNVAIGVGAGYNAGITPQMVLNSNSIFIGYNANANADDLTNDVVIGYQAQATDSNQTVIGNSSTTAAVIYGAPTFPYLSDSGCLQIESNVIESTGEDCGSGGSGNTTSTSLTTNTLPKANGENSIIDSSVSDDGTTVSTPEPIKSPSWQGDGSVATQFSTGDSSNQDPAGELSLSAATTASYSFLATYTSHPECMVTPQFDPGSDVRYWVTYTSSTSFTVNFSSSVTGTVSYVCIGRD